VPAQTSKLQPGHPICFVHHQRFGAYLAAVNVAGTGYYVNIFLCGDCLAHFQAEGRTRRWLACPSPDSWK
jgi:hypothetical protein